MDRQNVTLALPKELLREARHLAVERGSSLSRLLAEMIEHVVREDERYQGAMRRARRRMRTGFDLGGGGKASASRESLHER
ncbi:MAG: CopG family transcriptional regulator [Acidobacteriota bacterium]